MNKFIIIKDNDHIEISYEKIEGLVSKPKNKLKKSDIKITKIELVHPYLIEKSLDKKIFKQAENLIILINEEESSADDIKKALGEVDRLRSIILKKYTLVLEDRIIEEKMNKINVLLKEIAIRALQKEEMIATKKEEKEIGRSR